MGTLTDIQKGILSASGFLPSEIKEFDQAKTPDGKAQDINFDSDNFQAMIKERSRWRADLNRKGFKDTQIRALILSYYRRRGESSPFDFIKSEYAPPQGLNFSQFEAKRKASARQARILGGRYGRNRLPALFID